MSALTSTHQCSLSIKMWLLYSNESLDKTFFLNLVCHAHDVS